MRNIVVPFFTFLLAFLFALPANAQNCGCIEEDNCPETIAPVSNFNVCYTFTDAFNNDLADPAQGVCGVNLAFTHDYIWDLEMTLISPNGTEVMLVGENTMGTGGTTFTSWDVLFVGCGDAAIPDGTFEPVWTNDQNWPFIGAIGGSYYPVAGGCLEDFNSGAVNGQWCIEINSQSFTGGSLLDFEVILCDQSGIFCCDANGGDLDEELITCEGDDRLLLDLEVEYSNLPPDATLYGYTFLIGEIGGLLLEVSENPDLTGYVAGTYEVCGLSYDLAEDALIPMPDGIVTMQDIQDDLNGLSPSFCASLSDDCYPVTIGAPPMPIALLDTICIGEDYIIGDSTFSEPGDYGIIFNSFFDCDSLVNLSLTVLPIDTAYIIETICFGDSLVVSDSVFYATGNYEVYLAGASRCDSTYLVDLTIIAPVTENVIATICEGESYGVGSMSYSTTGIYSDTINSVVTGCDSIVNLDLEIIIVHAEVAPPDNITCTNSVITLDGTLSSDEPGMTYEWTEFAGGNILPPNDGATVQVSDNGLYKFKVTRFGCSDSVFINVLRLDDVPISNAGDTDSLTCIILELQLDGTASEMGDDIVYNWFTIDGNITENNTTLTPTINFAPATYSLSVLNMETGCADTSTVFISLSNDAPLVDAGDDLVLTCTDTTVLLDGSDSYINSEFTYVWTNSDDEIIPPSPSGNAQAITNAADIYTFTITNIETGCSASDDAEVTINVNLPIIDAGVADDLTCQNEEIQLSGTVGNSVDFTILWTGGSLIVNENTLTPTIDESGLFHFTVTDNGSNCPVIDSVLVGEVITLPNVDAGPEVVTLNCLLESWQLGDTDDTSLGDDFSQEWYLNDVVVSMDFPYEVSEAGIYILVVTNDLTGCTQNDTIEIVKDLLLPIADAGEDFELNCENASIILDGEELSDLPNEDDTFIDYAWYNEDDELIQFGEDSLLVVNPGMYYLVLSESITFCADTAYVNITQDASVPLADAGLDALLDCATGEITLDGTSSSVGDYSYEWSGPIGATIIGSTTLMPTVNAVGIYLLEVSSNTDDCSDLDEVEVTIDTITCQPTIVLNPGFETFGNGIDGIVDCLTDDQEFIGGIGYFLDTLDASGTIAPGINISYDWTALMGFVVDDDDPQFPIVTEGVFVLTVTNTLLNLSVSDTISVINIRDFPNADAGPNEALTCTNFQAGYTLDGTLSEQGGEFSYTWITDFGDFGSSDMTSLTPTVFAAGTYELLVINNTNGCESNAAVLLSLDGQIPSPCFNNEVQMECANSTIMIGDTCDINPDYSYSWTVIQDGMIMGADNEAVIEVQTDTSLVSAFFEVVVIDNFNSCTFIDTVEVFTAVNCYPDCAVNTQADTLTCLTTFVTLDGTGSSVGDEYAYLWEIIGGGGGLCGDEETLMPCVDTSGFYRLTVTNIQTGFECQSPLVFVNANDNPPDVEIDDSDNPAFTCNTDLVTLSVTSDDTDAYLLAWSSTEDCILTDINAPQIDINCDAIYSLTVTDINTGCENISDIAITYDTLPPALVIVNPNMASIGCNNPQVVLSGSGSSQGFYTWYRDDVLIPGAINLSYVANIAGEYCLEVTDMDNGCIASSCATVEADVDAVFADAGENQFLTCSATFATLMGDAPIGPEFTYQWSTDTDANCFSPAMGSLNVTATCPGTYTLTVTDFTNGCIGASSVEVIDMTASPITDAGPDMDLDCNITQVTLDGSASEDNPDFIYNWVGADGQGNPTPSDSLTPIVTAPGLYTLLILNPNTNCFDIDSVFVIQSADLPEVNAGDDDFLTCNEMQITLDGSASEQSDSLSYIWSAETGTGIISPINELDIIVNEDGNYILIITNDSTNCTSADTILVAMDTLSPSPIIVAENGGNINCFQDTITLDAANSEPIGDLDYQWHTTSGNIITPANLAEISLNQGGNYVLNITNTENGCVNDTTITVQQDFNIPFINIADPDMLTCVVQSVELNAVASQTNSLFEWTSTDGFSIINPETATPTVFEPGEYVLKLSSQDNGCDNEETIIVPQDITSPIAVANVEGTLDCVTNSVVLNGEGSSAESNTSYQWEGVSPVEEEAELVTTAFAAGDYSLIVINGDNGCQDTAMVEVIASGFPITELLMSNTNPNCADISSGFIQIDSVIGGNPPYYFSFDGSAFSEYDYRNYLMEGSYQVAVEDADGCEYEVSILLEENPSLLIDLGADIEIEIGDSIELSVQINLPEEAIDTIIWRPLPDTGCAGCPEQMITPSESMNVLVEVIDTFGCSATDNIFLYVVGGEELPVFVPTAFSPNNDGENDRLIVFGKSDVEAINFFQIFNRWGEMVYEAKDFLPENPDATWDGNHHNRPLNTQVFAWRMEYELRSTGEVRVVWGDVTLLR
ncbi:MAG: gliding motility-associated-like protein [Saprospiraceae bacterium]|jgi:gliding motility-associated-like protein